MSFRACNRWVTAALAVLLGTAAGAAEPPAPAAPVGKFILPARPIWAGEIFELGFTWTVDWDRFSYLEGPLEWDPQGMVTQPWEGPVQRLLPRSGASQPATISYRTIALAVRPGRLLLPSARQAMVVQTGVVRTSDYERRITRRLMAVGGAMAIEVRALPPAPRGFSGGIGRLAIETAISPKQVSVGDRLTWTLAVSGTAKWPALKGLPGRMIPAAFESSGAPRLSETPGRTLFERTVKEEVDLIVRTPGQHVLGPVSMTIFDPELGRYVELRTAPLTINVLARGRISGEAGTGRVGLGADASEPLPPLLPGSETAAPPLLISQVLLALTGGLFTIVAAWLILALLRARQADPERAARIAHRRIARTLAKLSRAASDSDRRRLVRDWQRYVGIRWKLNQAAPVPGSFGGESGWSPLWHEAELFLYGREGRLPSDWHHRAVQLLEERGKPPPFSPSAMFRRRNLYPICLLIAVSAAVPDIAQAAATQAEHEFRQRLEGNPLDWKARHNLAISLASAERWDEAAAQSAVAFVQEPASPATRTLWTRLGAKAGFPVSGKGIVPRPTGWLGMAISAAPPRAWQQMLIGSSLILSVGGMLFLIALFGGRRRAIGVAAIAVSAIGACGMAAATVSLSTYGNLAERDAALVWMSGPLRELPVETPVRAGESIAGAGLVGRVRGSFLEWRLLVLTDGRAGWVRKRALVPVWQREP